MAVSVACSDIFPGDRMTGCGSERGRAVSWLPWQHGVTGMLYTARVSRRGWYAENWLFCLLPCIGLAHNWP